MINFCLAKIMKTLQTIQKTLNVFRILSKVAYILCIVGAAALGVTALCVMTQYCGGTVFSLFGEPIKIFPDGTDLLQKFIQLLSATFKLTAEAILFGLTYDYLKIEQADGTPFTFGGAERLKKLGIRFIYIPLIAIVLVEIIAVIIKVKDVGNVDNYFSVMTGIVFILVSLVFKYGAEMQNNNMQEQSTQLNKTEE